MAMTREAAACLVAGCLLQVASGFLPPPSPPGPGAWPPRPPFALGRARLGRPMLGPRGAVRIVDGVHGLAASSAGNPLDGAAPGRSARSETAPERLLEWAKEGGGTVSSKIAVGGAGRVVATGPIEEGEVLVSMEETLSLSPAAVRKACPALVSFEEANEELKDFDVLVVGLLLAARGMIPACKGWRRGPPLDLPVFWDEASVEALGVETSSMVGYMRMDLEACIDVCGRFAKGADWEGSEPPGDEELRGAWALARSRATLQRSKDGREEARLYPLMEAFDHQPRPLARGDPAAGGPKFVERVPTSAGPAAETRYEGGRVELAAVRPVTEGEVVTVHYGDLTNQALLLGHGRLPAPFVHGANRVRFSLPGALFTKSAEAMGEGSSARLLEQKAAVLADMGVGEGDQLDLEVSMGSEPELVRGGGAVPVPLIVIVSYMCLTTDDEMAKLCVSVGGRYASIAPANEVRAYRWMGWLLGQVEEQLFDDGVRGADLGGLLTADPEGAAEGGRRKIFAAQLAAGEHLAVRYAKEAALARSEAVAQDNDLLTGVDASRAARRKQGKKYKGGKRAPRGFG